MTKGVGGSTATKELSELAPWPTPKPAISQDEREARREKARTLTHAIGADALLIFAGTSLHYFAGVPWGASERLVAMLLPTRGLPIVFCPKFEAGSLQASLSGDAEMRYWEEDEDPFALVGAALRETQTNGLALDPALPFGMSERLRAHAPSLAVVDASPVVDGCRARKSEAELALMRQAKAMTLEVHRRAARILHPGITATAVRRFIDDAHRALGAAGTTFCIVQFGRSTAYPHGLPGECVLAEDDMVLIDTGCAVQGYNSDITRSYVFGEPNAEQRKIWNLEHDAQQAAFEAAKPGVACETIDRSARDVLVRGGLGPDYRLPGLPHRTGHGIGLSVHEAPYLVRGDKTPLAPGMCFSNEPMIVIPDHFGVRLEDHFHVTETGAAWFTEPSPSIDAPFG